MEDENKNLSERIERFRLNFDGWVKDMRTEIRQLDARINEIEKKQEYDFAKLKEVEEKYDKLINWLQQAHEQKQKRDRGLE